jgi:hypothetical protein
MTKMEAKTIEPRGPLTNSEIIYQACFNLHNAGRQISRQVLVKVTGLTMGVLDDHVSRMVDHGRLRRVANGVLELMEQFPADRKIGKTIMRDGMIEIFVADQVMEVTPSEAGKIGQMLMGEATVFAQLRGDRDVSDKVARLERQAEDARRKLADQAREIARLKNQQQPELAFE